MITGRVRPSLRVRRDWWVSYNARVPARKCIILHHTRKVHYLALCPVLEHPFENAPESRHTLNFRTFFQCQLPGLQECNPPGIPQDASFPKFPKGLGLSRARNRPRFPAFSSRKTEPVLSCVASRVCARNRTRAHVRLAIRAQESLAYSRISPALAARRARSASVRRFPSFKGR